VGANGDSMLPGERNRGTHRPGVSGVHAAGDAGRREQWNQLWVLPYPFTDVGI
jgi:hypothetical protein